MLERNVKEVDKINQIENLDKNRNIAELGDTHL